MQYRLSAALLSALSLSQLAVAQVPVPLPEVTGDSGNAGSGCNGCYVVADVAGVVFGTETMNATQINSIIVAPGPNGTTVTTTSVQFDEGQFTLTSPGGIVPGAVPTGGAISFNTAGSTLVLNGVTLTSPTAYNVFTAFSTTRTTFVNGQCTVLLGKPTQLLTAFSVPIPTDVTDFASFQSVAEQSFIAAMGIPSCSNGAENFTPTTHIPVNVSTIATTITSSRTLTPASAIVTTTAAATPTVVSFAPFGNATLITPSSGQSVIVLPTQAGPTIVEASNAAPRQSAAGALLSGVVALVMGLVA